MEIKTYDVDGIQVRVRINYDEVNVSLINEDGNAKPWVFKNRGLEYMDGWVSILQGMLSAIESSRILLKKHVTLVEKVKAAKMAEVEKALREEK